MYHISLSHHLISQVRSSGTIEVVAEKVSLRNNHET